jgi:Na+/proline symporter
MALDIIVVMIYAVGMLGLGWYGMRRAKTHEDYLVAGRNLGPTLYMGTMATTVLGGASTVGTVNAWAMSTASPVSGSAPRWAWASSPSTCSSPNPCCACASSP